MKTLFVSLSFVLVVFAASAGDERKQSFVGEYHWSQGGSDRLTAEFTPTGKDTWKVRFRFKFSGKNYTWKGTATGGLEDESEMTGTAEFSSNRRVWTFNATIEDGVLSGKHAEIVGGAPSDTGTFVLRR